jgi:hypothetical protein
MTYFAPKLKPCLLVFYLKIFEACLVVFGPNQVWSSFGFDFNFKFSRAHSSASYFLHLACDACYALLPTTYCRRVTPPLPTSTRTWVPRPTRDAHATICAQCALLLLCCRSLPCWPCQSTHACKRSKAHVSTGPHHKPPHQRAFVFCPLQHEGSLPPMLSTMSSTPTGRYATSTTPLMSEMGAGILPLAPWQLHR